MQKHEKSDFRVLPGNLFAEGATRTPRQLRKKVGMRSDMETIAGHRQSNALSKRNRALVRGYPTSACTARTWKLSAGSVAGHGRVYPSTY